jgi:hypothetical protein
MRWRSVSILIRSRRWLMLGCCALKLSPAAITLNYRALGPRP